jgi:hypothetical protein
MIMEPVIALEIKSIKSRIAVDGPGFLPIIPVKSESIDLNDVDSVSSTTKIDKMRRASKRAINLLMRNIKKQ